MTERKVHEPALEEKDQRQDDGNDGKSREGGNHQSIHL